MKSYYLIKLTSQMPTKSHHLLGEFSTGKVFHLLVVKENGISPKTKKAS